MTLPDLSELRPVVRPRLYEQVAVQILAWVDDSGLRPGDRLLPERELSTKLGVSRATVRQALVALEVVGVVEVKQGNGAVITAAGRPEKVVEALRAHASRLPEILDARDALETKIAELAAERRTETDLAAIAGALAAMSEDIDAGGRGVDGDELFHAAVTAAAHSQLLAQMMAEIQPLIIETRLESLSQPGRSRESLFSHAKIATAIRQQKPAQAAAAMRAHLELVRDVAILRPD
jgi:GntR family transcriptional repressor for pyruvate dehydrogenase complex